MQADEQIIINCQKGNLKEFGILYDKYVKRIHDFIYFKTYHKETAEDLASKTFLKALEKISSYNSKIGTFSSWLYCIARNTVIDHYRTKKNTSDIEDVWDLSSGEDIESDIDARENLAQVKAHLAKLSPEHRDIVILRVWQEMSYAEIAEVLGKSEDSCKMMFSRTIAKLREEMPVALFVIFILMNHYVRH
ncbi:MAG: RNA polymerase sigma factor [Patescibacteria group bacterium]